MSEQTIQVILPTQLDEKDCLRVTATLESPLECFSYNNKCTCKLKCTESRTPYTIMDALDIRDNDIRTVNKDVQTGKFYLHVVNFGTFERTYLRTLKPPHEPETNNREYTDTEKIIYRDIVSIKEFVKQRNIQNEKYYTEAVRRLKEKHYIQRM